MNTLKESDEALMALYRQGDLMAFEKLYQRHQSKALGYLLNRVHSRQEAEEIFQASFLKMHHSKESYKNGSPFLPWFFTILKNSLYDHFRKEKSEKIKTEKFFNEQPIHESALDSDDGFETKNLGELISDIPQDQKDLVNQRYIEGLDFEKIAELNQTSPEAVRQSISRITRKLKMKYGGNN